MRLIVNRWNETDPARRAELELCARKNDENSHLEVVVVEAQERVTYQRMFDVANASMTSHDDISIIANADMYFDETIALAVAMSHSEAYALSRYDVHGDGRVTINPSLGIDVWVFRGRIKDVKADFPIGTWACDVRLNAEIHRAGYRLLNPAKTILSYHVHMSNVRNYTPESRYPGPELTVDPHELGDPSPPRLVHTHT